MQGLHANIGACMPATLAGPIHKTRVQRCPQYNQQTPSIHGFPSSVSAGAGRPLLASEATPGITMWSDIGSLRFDLLPAGEAGAGSRFVVGGYWRTYVSPGARSRSRVKQSTWSVLLDTVRV